MTPGADGYVTPHFKGGLRQVDAMRAAADRREALQLLDSVGDVWGNFRVTGITVAWRDIGPVCPPLRLEYQVTLPSAEVNRQGP